MTAPLDAHPVLVRQVRLVPVGETGPGSRAPARSSPSARPSTANGHDGGAEPTDVLLAEGRVAAVGPRLPAGSAEVVDADGRWAIPGLWDSHVHLGQWARAATRLDVAGARSAGDVVAAVAGHLATHPDDGAVVFGQGYRSARWERQPTVAELDAVAGVRPVVLTSGDVHNGWLSTAALRLLGLPDRTDVLDENDWFAVLPRLPHLPGARVGDHAGCQRVLAQAAGRGVVGVVDLEFDASLDTWPRRYAAGLDTLRVRTGVYPADFDAVLATGRRTGDVLPGAGGLATQGPLKVIADGSLNTRTAYVDQPYAAGAALDRPRGTLNVDPADLTALLVRASSHGFTAAVHAIGDAAAAVVLDAFAASGASGSMEHAQLLRREDLRRMASLGVVASVQPAHLLDDRDLTERCWPGRADRCFMFRSMLDAGVRLTLGSDAPVAPLDPWLAMAAAVHRSGDDRPPWHPEQAITAAEALAASTDGHGTVDVGRPADVVLLDTDPLIPAASTDEAAAGLSATVVATTVVAGRIVHDAR